MVMPQDLDAFEPLHGTFVDVDGFQRIPCTVCGHWPLSHRVEGFGDDHDLVATCPKCGHDQGDY